MYSTQIATTLPANWNLDQVVMGLSVAVWQVYTFPWITGLFHTDVSFKTCSTTKFPLGYTRS